jgi:hypothetical protein
MTWKRLEGGSIDPQMTEGISARLADPLWLLARQWQMGEFRGEDAASPVLIEGSLFTVPLTEFHVNGSVGPRRVELGKDALPLETLAEQEPVSAGPAAPFISLESGAALLRALAAEALPVGFLKALRTTYAFRDTVDASLDPVGAARLQLLARRGFDGAKLARAIAAAGGDPAALPEMRSLSDPKSAVTIIRSWLAEEAAVFRDLDPALPRAWSAAQLNYRFTVSARLPGEKTAAPAQGVELSAPEYPGGHLDWYAFDLTSLTVEKEGGNRIAGLARKKLTALPVPLQLPGMPASRWWEFEDGDVDFGDLAAGPEDIARSVIAAYAMVAGDDWYLLPCMLPAGSLARVTRISVLDDFGQRTEVPSTAVRDKGRVHRPWRWFELSGDPGPGEDQAPLLFLPPVVHAVEESRPLETVEIRRDELANLAWAIEQRVESAAGRAVDREAGRSIANEGAEPRAQDAWRYRLATDIPDHWVPLVPVRIKGERPQVVLRRGTIAADADSETGRAKGRILDPEHVFLLREEVVPSGGVRVTRRFQLARGANGSVHLWVGRQARPSGGPMRRTPLKFDVLSGWKAPQT